MFVGSNYHTVIIYNGNKQIKDYKLICLPFTVVFCHITFVVHSSFAGGCGLRILDNVGSCCR